VYMRVTSTISKMEERYSWGVSAGVVFLRELILEVRAQGVLCGLVVGALVRPTDPSRGQDTLVSIMLYFGKWWAECCRSGARVSCKEARAMYQPSADCGPRK
jgi:hypothetical protein